MMIDIKTKKYENLNYLECLPEKFSEAKKYPIIVFLHGAGSRGNGIDILKGQPIVSYATETDGFPFVMFLPQCYDSQGTWFDVFEQLQTFVDYVTTLPFVDSERVFLAGTSMGGYASWQMLMTKNRTFKKAIICCGGGMYWNASRIVTDVWAFHGTEDTTVYCEESKKMVNALLRLKRNAKLTLYEGVDHNCWDLTYSNPEIYAWLLE